MLAALALAVLAQVSPGGPIIRMPLQAHLPLLSIPPAGSVCGGTATGTRGEAVTTTRATVRGCACSADGSSYAVLGANTTCVEPLPDGSGNGVSVWGSHSNLLARSQEFDSTAWAKSNVAVSADSTAAPDGTLTADTLTASASGAFALQNVSISSASGAATLWVRSVSGEASARLVLRDSTASVNRVTTDVTATTAWQRIEASSASLVSGNSHQFIVYPANGASSGSLIVWGAQLNTGSTPAPYCPSGATAPVTCGPDWPTVSKPDSVSDTEGCFSADVLTDNPASQARILDLGGVNRFYVASSTALAAYDGTSFTTLSGLSSILGRKVHVVARWRASDSKMQLEADGSTATGSYDGAWLSSTIGLGDNSGGTGALNGHISNMKFYRRFGDCR